LAWSVGWFPGAADTRSPIPMHDRVLLEIEEVEAARLSPSEQFLRDMRVVREDNAVRRQQWTYGFKLAPLVFSGVIRVVKKDVNRFVQLIEQSD